MDGSRLGAASNSSATPQRTIFVETEGSYRLKSKKSFIWLKKTKKTHCDLPAKRLNLSQTSIRKEFPQRERIFHHFIRKTIRIR